MSELSCLHVWVRPRLLLRLFHSSMWEQPAPAGGSNKSEDWHLSVVEAALIHGSRVFICSLQRRVRPQETAPTDGRTPALCLGFVVEDAEDERKSRWFL